MIKAICLLLLFFNLNHAFARKIFPPKSDAEFSENKKIVCVKWVEESDTNLFKWSDDQGLKDEYSRLNYPENGIYRIEGRKLLWKVKINPNEDCEPLNDGQYVVIRNSRVMSKEDLAFAIYKDGRLISRYKIEDLCDSEIFSSFMYSLLSWYKDYNLDNDKHQITLKACSVNKVIDIKTGEISSRPYVDREIVFFILKGLFFIGYLFLPFLLYRLLHNKISKEWDAKSRYMKLLTEACIVLFVILYIFLFINFIFLIFISRRFY